MNRIVPVAIAVIHDPSSRKLLLTQRREIDFEDRRFGNCWNFPGGGIQLGEQTEDALKREIREELGIEIIIENLLPKIFSPVRGKWQGILLCYLCRMKVKESKIILNHESIRYDWFGLTDIKKLNMLPLGLEIAESAYSILSP